MKKVILICSLLFVVLTVSGQLVKTAVVCSPAVSTPPAGDNMISNGTFDDATDWTAGASWSITGGEAAYDDLNAGSIVQEDANMLSSIQPNTAYTLEFDIDAGADYGRLTIMNNDEDVTFVAINNYNTGHITLNFTSPADVSGGGLKFRASINSTAAFTIDNVELYEP